MSATTRDKLPVHRLHTDRVELAESYCKFTRCTGDPRISHESTVGYRLKLALNAAGFNFVRMNPSRYGLTACTLGLIDHKRGIVLWHERYAVEDAAKAYNSGEVVFQRVAVDHD